MINFYEHYNKPTLLFKYNDYGVLIEVLTDCKPFDLIDSWDERLEPIEHIIKRSSMYVVDYAAYVKKGRWPEAEPLILTKPFTSYSYAHKVIKGRWAEAESIISTNSYCDYIYCRDVLKLDMVDPSTRPSTWV